MDSLWEFSTGTLTVVAVIFNLSLWRIFLVSKPLLVFSKSSTPFSPAPDTAWYVEYTILFILYLSSNGFKATTAWIVEQFGLAMIPLFFSISSELTSGTTSGTSLSILKALLLSITITPLDAAIGAYFLDTSPPAQNMAKSNPSSNDFSFGS